MVVRPNTTVENPFKREKQSVWVHYVVTSLCCLAVLWIVTSVLTPSTPKKEMNLRWTENPPQEYQYVGPMDDEEDFEADAEDAEEEEDPLEEGDEAEEDEQPVFPELTVEQYPAWLQSFYTRLDFDTHVEETTKDDSRILTLDILDTSIRMGCDNMVTNMKPEGNFNYQYDFVSKQLDDDDMAVRQAGALWGLSLCFQHQPRNHMYQVAVEKGIDFYASHMAEDSDDNGSSFRYIDYPGSHDSESGANALFGLALIEYLRTVRSGTLDADDERVQRAEDLLKDVIGFLKFMQMDDKHFSHGYRIKQKRKRAYSSSYYDGETMLCLIKAAKYIDGYSDDLVPIIEEAAPIMAKQYTVDAWRDEHDSDETKGFYQWSSMLFTEYYEARYKDYEVYGDYVIVLGHWIIHTHDILDRPKNTGYAHEGIISAYTIAKARSHQQAVADFAFTIDRGLYKLTQWQVAGPLAHENEYLGRHPTDEKIAIGAIMNGRTDPTLRIDTTQHQMHALIMAATLVYN